MSKQIREYIAKSLETDQEGTIKACGLLLVAVLKSQEREQDMEESVLTLSIELQGKDYKIEVSEIK